MALYRIRPREVDAVQWFKNGDHPDDYPNGKVGDAEGAVVRYFRRPDVAGRVLCGRCKQPMEVHGWLDTPPYDWIVCPGNWVITEDGGARSALDNEAFFDLFEPVED